MREKRKEKQEWRGGREIEIEIKRWTQQNQTVSLETGGPGQSAFVLEEQFTDQLWVAKCLDSTY